MILKLAYHEIDPVVDSYWNDMRKHDYNKSFPAIKDFIHQNSSNMKASNNRRSRITWVFAVLLPLLIIFSCKRKTYVEHQGITLSFIAKDSVQSTIDFLLHQYGEKEWKSILHSHAGTIQGSIYAPAESYNKLKALAARLKLVPGVSDLFLSAMSTTVQESPLSRLSYTILNWHIDSLSTSDEQLSKEIDTRLEETGMSKLKLQLVNKNGKRQIMLLPNSETDDFSINLTLRDGTNVTAVAEKW